AKITDAAEWRRVGLGARVIAGGLCLWLAAYALYRVPLCVGLAVGEEYASAAEDRLRTRPPHGQAPPPGPWRFAIALVGVTFWGTRMIWLVRLSQLLFLFLCPVLLAGYFICLVVPDRYGTRLQLFVLMGLSLANAFFLLVFRLLPMFGVYEYTILPFAVPEVV